MDEYDSDFYEDSDCDGNVDAAPQPWQPKPAERIPRYYEQLGRSHDYLMRCKDCKALVPFAIIESLSCCDQCGNKRFSEITLLNDKEMADIQSGVIDFPDRELFLKEFSPVRADA